MRRVGRRRNTKQRWIIVGVLSALFIFSTGYALLATRLNIRGTSNISSDLSIYISDIQETALYHATTNTAEIGSDRLSANFDVSLEMPGSYAEYTVTVKNDSNFNVKLSIGNDSIWDYINYEEEPYEIYFSTNGITEGEILEAGETVDFILRADFDINATSIPTINHKDIWLQLNYEQVSGETSIPTEDSCFVIDGGNNTILEYNCNDTDIIIPRTVNGYPMHEIQPNAFASKNLTSVVIPDSITTIGGTAFANNNLTEVTIPNSVTSMGSGAFSYNPIEKLTLSRNLTTIPEDAFYGSNLTEITIYEQVTSIGKNAFGGLTGTVEVSNRPALGFNWCEIFSFDDLGPNNYNEDDCRMPAGVLGVNGLNVYISEY